MQPLEQVLAATFESSSDYCRQNFWLVCDVQKELEKHIRSTDLPSLKVLGQALKSLRYEKGGIDGRYGYYLKLKSTVEQ